MQATSQMKLIKTLNSLFIWNPKPDENKTTPLGIKNLAKPSLRLRPSPNAPKPLKHQHLKSSIQKQLRY
uniref:Uncharacterized protein n=1 Tax=Rhizophora mucronata TaxID=61149 RepID=A0A2P2PPW9_RHIMU